MPRNKATIWPTMCLCTRIPAVGVSENVSSCLFLRSAKKSYHIWLHSMLQSALIVMWGYLQCFVFRSGRNNLARFGMLELPPPLVFTHYFVCVLIIVALYIRLTHSGGDVQATIIRPKNIPPGWSRLTTTHTLYVESPLSLNSKSSPYALS